jgi:acetylornithine deacetylase
LQEDERMLIDEDRLHATVDTLRSELIAAIQDLVRIPTENLPPGGNERAGQAYLARRLRDLGLEVDLYTLDQVPGLTGQASYWPGRDYRDRPNLTALWRGQGGGRSLLLTGHTDTVPRGSAPWSIDPFGGEYKDGRIYGLGAIDMKGPLAAYLLAIQALQRSGVRLRGDLVFESVVDEEFGGVNGTIAGRLHGPRVDGAILAENTGLDIYPAARGFCLAHIFFKGPSSLLAIGKGDSESGAATEQLLHFLTHLKAFNRRRRQGLVVPPLYQDFADPVPVLLAKAVAGGWGEREPLSVPADSKVELYWQLMPGEDREAVLRQFYDWLAELVADAPQLYAEPPRVEFNYRIMPGTQMDSGAPLVTELAACVRAAINRDPAITGAPYPCDLFAIQQDFRTPAVVFGPAGSNAHTGDEYIDVESALSFVRTLALFIARWCGVAS